jgi:zinc transporter ZupT
MEIQRADRLLRKRIFLGVLLAAVAGVVALVAVQSWLSELLPRPPAAGTKQATLVAVLAWSIGVTCLLLVGLAV